MANYIGEIASAVTCISAGSTCLEVDQLFQEDQSIHCIVVEEKNGSTALITRSNFYQKMGTRYGYNLYLKRPIELIANNAPLIVDYHTSIIETSKAAMGRTEEETYDDVIILRDNRVYGSVSIKTLLVQVADIQIEMASYLNPLTRLPGNNNIAEKLASTFDEQEEFTVLYVDLDRFKTYNDFYGFKRGDDLLRYTAKILKNSVDQSNGFLGHIGGDDFIIILHNYGFERMCSEIIREFDGGLEQFYNEEHLADGYIIMENRAGTVEEIPLVSISIAVGE